MLADVQSREESFEFLEEYSASRAKEIKGRKTVQPLLKTFVIETARDVDPVSQLKHILTPDICELESLRHEVFRVHGHNGAVLGLIEPLPSRYFLLYTIDPVNEVEPWVKKVVRDSVELDHLWLSGPMFDVLWQRVLLVHPAHRFTQVKFEFDNYFDRLGEATSHDDRDEDVHDERRVSASVLYERLGTLQEALPTVRSLLPAFQATTMLRLPSQVGAGGHDVYQFGKVTNRADSFLDHRGQVVSIIQGYERVTRRIEDQIWVTPEPFDSTGGVHLKGSAVVLKFSKDLSEHAFRNFVTWTFEESRGPFRLWGQPEWCGPAKVHVHGLDLHLWQQVSLEITRRHILAVLPEGTCGNTVHRLVTNVQRHLDPAVQSYIGSEPYENLISAELLGRPVGR